MAQSQRQEKQGPRGILVSACLLGFRCRYDGNTKDKLEAVKTIAQDKILVPFCPELAGGLAVPRPAATLSCSGKAVIEGEGRVYDEKGNDLTEAFLSGAKQALTVCQRWNITQAICKEHSPSCGFTSTNLDFQRAAGPGITTSILLEHGVQCYGC